MQLIKGSQFLNITFLLLLYGAAAVPVFGTVKVPLTYMYTSLLFIIIMLILDHQYFSILFWRYLSLCISLSCSIFFSELFSGEVF